MAFEDQFDMDFVPKDDGINCCYNCVDFFRIVNACLKMKRSMGPNMCCNWQKPRNELIMPATEVDIVN